MHKIHNGKTFRKLHCSYYNVDNCLEITKSVDVDNGLIEIPISSLEEYISKYSVIYNRFGILFRFRLTSNLDWIHAIQYLEDTCIKKEKSPFMARDREEKYIIYYLPVEYTLTNDVKNSITTPVKDNIYSVKFPVKHTTITYKQERYFPQNPKLLKNKDKITNRIVSKYQVKRDLQQIKKDYSSKLESEWYGEYEAIDYKPKLRW